MTRANTILALMTVTAAMACSDDKRDERTTPSKAPPASHPHGDKPMDITNPLACATCHPLIVDEWRGSMHARAHHSRDPIYAGVRAIRAKKEGADIVKACARCHTPGFESDPDAEGAAVGVGCATCHNALVKAEPGQLLGPNDIAEGTSANHRTGPASPLLADGTSVCKTCHEELSSPTGVSMCATGAEHSALEGEAKQSCGSCHMPRVGGPPTLGAAKTDHASHAFLGPHRAWYQNDPSFAATAVETTAEWSGSELTVRVANKSGHAFPTGFPGRQAIIACVGRDDAGTDVWTCKPRVLGKKYVDAAGKPTLAPYAERLESDTRIPPGGTDTFTAKPPKDVATVEVTVSMRLLPEPLANKLGLAEAPEGAAKQIATASATRPR